MVTKQVNIFFSFFIIGAILSLVFDIFRGYRKSKNNLRKYILFQDILFCIIVCIALVVCIINVINEDIRLYMFIAIFIGIAVYIKFFSRFFLKVFTNYFTLQSKILKFIFAPFEILKQIICNIYIILKKIIEKTCKKIHFMVSYLCKVVGKNMSKYVLKKKSKKIISIWFVAFIVFTAYFINTAYNQQIKLNDTESKIEVRNKRVEYLNKEIENCNTYLEKKQNMTDEEYSEFIEKYARSIGYVMPYEQEFEDVNK